MSPIRLLRRTSRQIRTCLEEWWRPATGLLCLPAAPFATYVGDLVGKPMSVTKTLIVLTFVAYLYSFRGWEKWSAVAIQMRTTPRVFPGPMYGGGGGFDGPPGYPPGLEPEVTGDGEHDGPR